MKKKLWSIPLFLLVLSSCNFPLFQNKQTTDAVSTRVALTLQALGTETPTPETVTIVTATPETAATASFTPSPEASPTATSLPDDPKLSLGLPSFAETFDTKSSFGLQSPYSDDAVTMSVSDGSLNMVSTRTQGGIRWRLTYPTPGNFYLEGTFTTGVCSGSDYYGMALKSPSYTDGIGYYYGLTCNGQFAFFSMNGASDRNYLVNWTSDPSILSGANQTNRLGVMVNGDKFSLYINGKFIQDVTDSKYTQNGHFGVFISAVETSNFTVFVNEINEWNQP
jgi:hypothetical protein